jgi:outer membrane protein OmpA-like peptidoglycan-associated protein
MKFLLLLVTLAFATYAGAQAIYTSALTKAQQKTYEGIIYAAQTKNYTEAALLSNQLLRQVPNFFEGGLTLAGLYNAIKKYDSAVYWYQKSMELDNTQTQPYFLPFAICQAGNGNFTEALNLLQVILQNPNTNDRTRQAALYRKTCFELAQSFVDKRKNFKFNPVNMGDSINSADSEYYPTISIDEKKLVFTRRINGFNEDFFIAEKNTNVWAKAKPMLGNINSSYNEGAPNLTQDGQQVVMAGCEWPTGEGSCDIYISNLNQNQWSEPTSAGININTEFWESSPSISPDKQKLFFSSNKPGGYGGKDLYVSYKSKNGSWMQPINLGPLINTKADESCPFLHADGETLYFTSNGLPGIGADDLFFTKWLADSSWAAPVNLGYPINTIDSEGSLAVNAKGDMAFFASDRSDSRGGLDIYSFNLPAELKPLKTTWLQAIIYNELTKQGLPVKAQLFNVATKKLVFNGNSSAAGQLLVTLPANNEYRLYINTPGYFLYNQSFNIPAQGLDSVFYKNIYLKPLQKNAAVVINNIYFNNNQFNLRPESSLELDKLAELMLSNPSLVISIEGHTDNVGKLKDNQTLSAKRAQTVVNYLILKDVPAARMQSKGWGSTKPIATNKTEAGKAQNRRTEMRIIEL